MDEGRNMILLFPTLIDFGKPGSEEAKQNREIWAPSYETRELHSDI